MRTVTKITSLRKNDFFVVCVLSVPGVAPYRFPGLVHLPDTEVLQRNNPTRLFILETNKYKGSIQRQHMTHSERTRLFTIKDENQNKCATRTQ